MRARRVHRADLHHHHAGPRGVAAQAAEAVTGTAARGIRRSPATTGTWSPGGPTWTGAAAPTCGRSSPAPASPATGEWPSCAPRSRPASAPFTAVICENIERTGRDFPDALRLERELNAAGVLILATDEPIDAAAPDAAVRLVRRVKQGIAEYFRYNLKTQMWEGLKEYAISGHNTGRCPYGYAEDRTPHPNPMKASMGATRARLVIDPERGPWVTKMFEWRAVREAVARPSRAGSDEQGAPAPAPGTPWSTGTVRAILRQPQVHRADRHRPDPQHRRQPRRAQDAQRPARALDLGRRRQRAPRPGRHGHRGKPPRPSAASTATSATTRTGDPRPDRPLRSRIRCDQCTRRMCVKPNRAGNGKTYVYWVCPHNPPTPATPPRTPATSAPPSPTTTSPPPSTTSSTGCSGTTAPPCSPPSCPPPRPRPTSATSSAPRNSRLQAAQNETAQSGLITQLAQMGSDTSPTANAMRERITAQFNDLLQPGPDPPGRARRPHRQPGTRPRRHPASTNSPTPPPTSPTHPSTSKPALYDAFDIHALYRAAQATGHHLGNHHRRHPRHRRRPAHRPPHRQRHIWKPATCR